MEELENKTFLIKVRSELFEYLKSENKHEKVGKLKVFLNKKRNKPEFIFHFNKKEEPKTFSLSYNKTNDFLYFGDKETKEGFKVGNVDNFGNLIINEEEIADELIKDAELSKEEIEKLLENLMCIICDEVHTLTGKEIFVAIAPLESGHVVCATVLPSSVISSYTKSLLVTNVFSTSFK